MKLVAGLGNPGDRYRHTPHNVGFAVLDEVARRRNAEFERFDANADFARIRLTNDLWFLLKPMSYMNLSGEAVRGFVEYYRVGVHDVLIVVDDVNLPLGRLRARRSGSAGGHNGLKSVIQHLGTTEFSRLRIGVGRGENERALADYVTSRFAKAEREMVCQTIDRAADAAEMFLTDGIEKVMNRFNPAEDRANREL